MATWKIVRHVRRDPGSVEYVGPTLKLKAEAAGAMRAIADRQPVDALGREYTYTLSKVG